jgi:hypothetical protein
MEPVAAAAEEIIRAELEECCAPDWNVLDCGTCEVDERLGPVAGVVEQWVGMADQLAGL